MQIQGAFLYTFQKKNEEVSFRMGLEQTHKQKFKVISTCTKKKMVVCASWSQNGSQKSHGWTKLIRYNTT